MPLPPANPNNGDGLDPANPSGGGNQTLQEVTDNGNTSTNDIVVTGGKIVADEIETSGASLFVSQRVKLGAYANELSIEDFIDKSQHVPLTFHVDEFGTASKPTYKEFGPDQTFESEPIDTDLATSNIVTLPITVGSGDFVSKIYTWNFQDAGKPILVRTIATTPMAAQFRNGGESFDLFGTSEDPYLRFTSLAGLTEVVLPSPVPTNVGVTYTTTIETEDGSPLNILGNDQGGGIFNPYIEVTIQTVAEVDFETEDPNNKGAANGYAPLDGAGHVPAVNLPSYVDEVLEFTDLASFPGTGETGKIYVALDTNLTYRWSGSTYVELTDTTAVWGNVSGTLSNQTDLQSALDGKENSFSKNTAHNKNFGVGAGDVCEGNDSRLSDDRNPTAHSHSASDITDFDTEVSNNSAVAANTSKVSADGSVTSHSDVTDAGSGAIITSAERTNLSNQSGTNTGDQDLSDLALKSNVLELDNTDAFTPDADYEPATKKYVDDSGFTDISCKVTKTATQSIPNATLTAITWDQESYDTNGMHDTVTNNTRVTFNTAGKYSILAQAEWESAGGNFRFLEIMKNGSGGIARVRYGVEGASENIVPYVGEFQVSDYIELCVYQDAGGNIDFEPGTGVENTYLEAHKIN